MFDGKTTGPETAVQIIAARRKLLDLRTDAPARNSPGEAGSLHEQQVDSSLTPDQVAALASENWAANPQLRNEFMNEAGYVALCKAQAAGRVKFINRRVQ
jgi:hypothetical protein